jgi:hypothetical protein
MICLVDIATARYGGAIAMALMAVWSFLCYRLCNTLASLENLIEALNKDLDESIKREAIAKQEFTKMRHRAEDAEKKYQALLDDTPARDSRGRYTKR